MRRCVRSCRSAPTLFNQCCIPCKVCVVFLCACTSWKILFRHHFLVWAIYRVFSSYRVTWSDECEPGSTQLQDFDVFTATYCLFNFLHMHLISILSQSDIFGKLFSLNTGHIPCNQFVLESRRSAALLALSLNFWKRFVRLENHLSVLILNFLCVSKFSWS